jgi:hypothetical protein
MTTAPADRSCGLCVGQNEGVTNDLPAGTQHPDRPPDNGRNQMPSGPDAVRYMSVHSWKQPDSHGRSGTSSSQKQQPARQGKPSSQAIFAGGGRCWVRTNVGEADGFTGSPLQPLPTGTDLRILHSDGREIGPLSVWRPCRASCPGQSHAPLLIRSHGVQVSPTTSNSHAARRRVRCSPTAPPCRLSQPACGGQPG